MKKLITLVVCNLFTMLCFSQFLDVRPKGTKKEVLEQFASRGFEIVSVSESEGTFSDVFIVKGNYNNVRYEVIVHCTPKTKMVSSFTTLVWNGKNGKNGVYYYEDNIQMQKAEKEETEEILNSICKS